MNITVATDFFDGTLAEEFSRLGYPAKWKAGEKRNIPESLIKRIVTSGGQITIADDNAKESKIVIAEETAKIDIEQYAKEKYKKEKTVKVVFPEGFRDGTLSDELAALGHPAEFGLGEIISLPLPLIEKIRASGGLVETDSEVIDQQKNQQEKHKVKIEQWQAEHKRQVEESSKRKEATEHNKEIQQEIEDLSARAITATGKTKEALWKRIRELYSKLQ
jgi:hypothetical protein